MRGAKSSGRAALPLLQPKTHAKPLSKWLGNAGADSPASSSASTAPSTVVAAPPPRARLASEELVVPPPEQARAEFYGVDVFSPTLVDLLLAERKRVVWSARAHRKMMATLHLAMRGQAWRRRSLAFWASALQALAFALWIVGVTGEMLVHRNPPSDVHREIDSPLLLGALCLVAAHVLRYWEVLNSCHNLECWLEEYFGGMAPELQRRYYGAFPTRIDFWTEVLALGGALLLVVARSAVLLLDASHGHNFGVISVRRDRLACILAYWVPFFLGAFCLLFSAYLAHVEVMHRWFSWRLERLEQWATGLGLLSAMGFFLASTLQFFDPWSVLVAFQSGMLPLGLGCFFGLLASALSLHELEALHQRHVHPEYGMLNDGPTDYGSV